MRCTTNIAQLISFRNDVCRRDQQALHMCGKCASEGKTGSEMLKVIACCFGKCEILKTSHGLSSKSEPFAMPIFRKSHCTILRHLAKVDLEASPGKALRRLEVGESQGGQV